MKGAEFSPHADGSILRQRGKPETDVAATTDSDRWFPHYGGSMTEAELKFVSPPVRAVELTLFFRAVALKLTDLAPLAASLRKEFPNATERFQLAPWEWEENAPDSMPAFVEGGSFPFPWLTFSNEEGKSISFQDDRLVLRWEFGGGRDYPGYDRLVEQLAARFEEFKSHAEDKLGTGVEVLRARAEYDNEMPVFAAWSVSKQAHGVASSDLPRRPAEMRSANAGGSYRFVTGAWRTKVEYAATSREDSEQLSLRATTVAQNETLDELPFEALGEAHSHLLRCFTKLTTQEQHEMWGMK